MFEMASSPEEQPRLVAWPPAWLEEHERVMASGTVTPNAAASLLRADPIPNNGAAVATLVDESMAGTASPVNAASPPSTSNRKDVANTDTKGKTAPDAIVRQALDSGAPILVDLETRSAVSLEVGGRRYSEDPSTEILTLVALWDQRLVLWTPLVAELLSPEGLWPDGYEACGVGKLPVQTFAGPDFPTPLRRAIESGRCLCAHNAFEFDRHIWRAKGLPEPSGWHDSMPEARAAGLPGKLDELGKYLLGVGKHAGSVLLKRLCRPNRDGEFPHFGPAEAAEVARYCVADVLLLAKVWATTKGSCELDVVALDRVINERGVAFDHELAEALIRLDEAVAADAATAVETATGREITSKDLSRTKFLLEWLRSKGVNLPNMQRETIENHLEDETASVDAAVRTVLRARVNAAKVTTGKLRSALASVSKDGRLRDQFVYHRCHTGRWSGRGVQIQNLPRPDDHLKNIPGLIEAASDPDKFCKVLPPGITTAQALSGLVRSCLRAAPGKVLLIADFAGIEARGLAWCAGERRLLDLFASGSDIYCDFGSELFGFPVTAAHKRERGVAKVGILGCGYSMGPAAFERHAAKSGVDLAAVGLTPEAVVEQYRDAYPAIAGVRQADGPREGGIWQELEILGQAAAHFGDTYQVAHCQLRRAGDALVIQLPSGRCLRYRNARVEILAPGYATDFGLPARPRPTLLFDSPRKRGQTTYGGKLTENVVQAICRDLLAAAMLACEREGLPVVLHVHDEIVIEAPEAEAESALSRLAEIMSTPPAWANGFPIRVEAFTAERYYKTPQVGSLVVTAQDGRVIESRMVGG
jgi:DNA polymerase